jgi:hypothetical protein
MLMQLYEKSVFAAQSRMKEEEEEENKIDQPREYHGNEATCFHAYSNLIVKKYVDKMDSLRKIETAL